MWYNLGNMNTEMNIKELIEWYITAGVEEIAGDTPFVFAQEEISSPILKNDSPSISKQESNIFPRQATTVLAQATQDARQNARELCKTAENLEDLQKLVKEFDGCSLKLTAKNTVFGDGNPTARIMLIGEAPGADEDQIGKPFVGRSGQLLDLMLKAIGLDRNQCYITNVLPWRPPGNRTPTDAEIAVCLPFLKRQIEIINPDYLFVLGGSAANALLDCNDSISKLRGHWLTYKTSAGKDIDVLASFHPAYLLRNPGQKAKVWSDLLRLSKKFNEIK